MKKETDIGFLKECITDSSMDEFSQWIHDNKWSKNNNNALWFHYKKMYENLKFSEVYQLFLEDKKM